MARTVFPARASPGRPVGICLHPPPKGTPGGNRPAEEGVTLTASTTRPARTAVNWQILREGRGALASSSVLARHELPCRRDGCAVAEFGNGPEDLERHPPEGVEVSMP